MGVVVALVAAGGALALTGTLSAGSSDAAGGAAGLAARTGDRSPASPAVDADARRPLSPAAPLRLWIAGDSLAGSLGPSLGEVTAATGVVQPEWDSRVSSGLTNTAFFDWPAHATEELARVDPEAVVFIIGTNDANVWDDAQTAEYTQRTEAMMRLLVGNGRDVYWVNAPVVKSPTLEADVEKVDAVQRAVAARVPGITYVDAHALFASAAGTYQSSIVDPTGKKVSMRAGDGIHLSPDGGDYLADAVFRLMDARWRITAQKAGPPKEVRVTKGATQVGGTYRPSGSASGSGSSSSGSSTYHSTTTTRSYSSRGYSSPPSTSPPATTPTTTYTAPPPPSTTPTTSTPPTTIGLHSG